MLHCRMIQIWVNNSQQTREGLLRIRIPHQPDFFYNFLIFINTKSNRSESTLWVAKCGNPFHLSGPISVHHFTYIWQRDLTWAKSCIIILFFRPKTGETETEAKIETFFKWHNYAYIISAQFKIILQKTFAWLIFIGPINKPLHNVCKL